MSMSQPHVESQSGLASVTILKDRVESTVGKDNEDLDAGFVTKYEGGSGYEEDVFDGSGGNGKFTNGRGGGDNNGGDDNEEDELGPIMKFEEVMKETEAQGASLPSDMLEAAKNVGIRKLLLLRYLDFQGSAWPLGFGLKYCSMLRSRMLADPSFSFQIWNRVYLKLKGQDVGFLYNKELLHIFLRVSCMLQLALDAPL